MIFLNIFFGRIFNLRHFYRFPYGCVEPILNNNIILIIYYIYILIKIKIYFSLLLGSQKKGNHLSGQNNTPGILYLFKNILSFLNAVNV
jgi:hypothetical protein